MALTLIDLPMELIEHILYFMPENEILKMRLVSRFFHISYVIYNTFINNIPLLLKIPALVGYSEYNGLYEICTKCPILGTVNPSKILDKPLMCDDCILNRTAHRFINIRVKIGKTFNLRSDMFDISQNQYSYEYYHYIYNNGITIISKNNTDTFDLTHLDFRKYYTNSRNNYIWDGIIIQNDPYPKEYCDRFDYTIIKEKANKKKNNSPNTKLFLPIKFEIEMSKHQY